MLASTLLVACSMTETLLERSLATKIVPIPLADVGAAGARASTPRSAASEVRLRNVFKLSVQIIEKNQQLSDYLVHLGGERLADAQGGQQRSERRVVFHRDAMTLGEGDDLVRDLAMTQGGDKRRAGAGRGAGEAATERHGGPARRREGGWGF